MISYVTGDATRPQGDGPKLLAHICNDRGGWGKGFVLAVSKRWREPEAAYRSWSRVGIFHGTEFKLGHVQIIEVEPDLSVANMIAQCGYGRGGVPPIRYDALRQCLVRVFERAAEVKATVHMPRIGTGLAGGRWEMIEPLLIETNPQGAPTFVYDLPTR